MLLCLPFFFGEHVYTGNAISDSNIHVLAKNMVEATQSMPLMTLHSTGLMYKAPGYTLGRMDLSY